MRAGIFLFFPRLGCILYHNLPHPIGFPQPNPIQSWINKCTGSLLSYKIFKNFFKLLYAEVFLLHTKTPLFFIFVAAQRNKQNTHFQIN